MALDNRNLIKAAKVFRRRRLAPLHLKIQIGEKSIVYCYIRKNACSAFKQLFVDVSPYASKRTPPVQKPIRFLEAYHKARFPKDYWKADHVILVYRDPIERAVSVFKNKFVMRSGHRGIHANFERITGVSPDQTTFSDFVYSYLTHCSAQLDSHVMPQSQHLLPVRYTDAIPLAELNHQMRNIIGEKLADLYFKEKLNATANFGKGKEKLVIEETNCDIPSAELHRQFVRHDKLPASSSFLNDQNIQALKGIYAEDYDLIERIQRGVKSNKIA